MPTVPVYNSFQVQERPVSGVRQESNLSTATLSGGADNLARIADAGGRVSQAVVGAQLAIQDRQNVDMLFRAETALQADYTEYKASAAERRGQNAWGITKDTGAWFDKVIEKHVGNLENDAQKALFKQQATKLRTQGVDHFSGYEVGQRRASLEEAAQASIVGSINNAAAVAAEAARGAPGEAGFVQAFDVSGQKADIIKRVAVQAQVNGWGAELRAAKEGEALTNFHKQVLQARVDKDPTGAKAYFEANKGEINGADHDTLGKALAIGGLKETAQTFADQVEANKLGELDAIKLARAKFSGDEEAATVAEIKTRFGEQSQARERSQKDASDAAWKTFSQTGRLGSIPAATLAAMDGKDIEALRNHARVLSEGRAVKTDPGTYLDLRDMMRDNPQGFAKLDLRRYIGKLSTGELHEFAKLQGNTEKLKDAATLDGQLSNIHDQLGWSASDREKKGKLDIAVANAVNEEQKQRGKTLDYTERQKIIDRLVIEGEVLTGSLYKPDPNKSYYEVAGTPDAAKFAPKIPDADRSAIVERYKKKRERPPTEDEIVQTYKIWKGL